MQFKLVCRCGFSTQDVEQRVDAMRGPTVADLLSTGVRERAAPHALIELLQRLATCPRSQQQLLYDAQGSEVLVSLLQHKEPSVQLEACLALTCIQEPSIQRQCINAGPLVATLSGALHAQQSATRSRSTQVGGKPAISTKSTNQQSTTAATATWLDISRLAAAAFVSSTSPRALEEVCRTRPDLLSTLPQLLVDTVEGALHEQVAQQQAVVPGQPWQLPAARAAMAGLLQLLCCGSQQVHCAVVRQLCRLAYCTCVLEQLGVGLPAYPGAVAAVVALVQPWSQEGFAAPTSTDTRWTTATASSTTIAKSPLMTAGTSSLATSQTAGRGDSHDINSPSKSTRSKSTGALTTTTTSSNSSSTTTNSSSRQWPGGAPELQAEAAAALLVLSSLGSGARELVTCDAQAIHGLLLALSIQPWQPQRQQQVGVAAAASVPRPNLERAAQLFRWLLAVLLVCAMPLGFVFDLLVSSWQYGPRKALGCVMGEYGDILQDVMVGIKAWWAWWAGLSTGNAAAKMCAWCWDAGCLWWGVCYELLVLCRAFLAVFSAKLQAEAGGRMFAIVQGQWPLTVTSKQWVQLRREWAVYCLWHLCCEGPISRSVLQQHAGIAKQALQQEHLAGAVRCVSELQVQFGFMHRTRLPATELKAIGPPLLPHLLTTWRHRLDSHALAVLKDAWAELEAHFAPAAMLLLVGSICACALQLVALLPTLEGLQHLSTLLWCLCACAACVLAWMAITSSMQAIVGTAAVLVVTFISRPSSYQVLVASRPAPAAAPPRTWLQPITYLALDFSHALNQQAAGTSVVKLSRFGSWPVVAPFSPNPCAAQHVFEARKEWLLLKLAWSHMGVSLLAGVLWWGLRTPWAVRLLSAPSSSIMLQWVWPAWAASLKLCGVAMVVSTALVQLCCVAVQPSYLPLRCCAQLGWCCVAGIAWLLTACLLAAWRGALRTAFGIVLLPWTACKYTMACVLAAGRAAAYKALATVRLGVGLALLPARIIARAMAAVCGAAGRLRRQTTTAGHAIQQQQQQQQLLAGPGASHMLSAAMRTKTRTGSSSRPGIISLAGGSSMASGAATRHRLQRVAVVDPTTSGPSTAREGRVDASCATSVAADATGTAVGAGFSSRHPPTAGYGGWLHSSQPVAGPQDAAGISIRHQAAAPETAAAQAPQEAAVGTRRPLHTGATSQTPSIPGSRVQPVADPSISTMSTAPPEAASPATPANDSVAALASAAPQQQQQQQQQQEAALAAGEQVANAAARVAAAAASAAGHPLEEVHLAAARAAAEALQARMGQPVVEPSMLVVQAALTAAGLYAAGRTSLAASAAAGVAAAPTLAAATAASAAGDTVPMAGTGLPPAAAAPTSPLRPRKVRQECVVCLDAHPSVTTHPCGHRVLCGGCAQLVAASKGECPMCRAAVVRYEAGPGRV